MSAGSMQDSPVVVTGANGFVGLRVTRALLARGREVRALVRRPSALSSLDPQSDGVIMPELGGSAAWGSILSGADCVVHLAARVHVMADTDAEPLQAYRRVNVEGTCRLAEEASQAGVRRFIFMSSIKVNGEKTVGEPFRSTDSPAPADPYGISKCEAEAGLREIAARTGLEVVIIRPPLVYGPGVRANFLKLMRSVARGVPLPLGAVENRRSLVYVENLASLVAECVTSERAVGETFLVSDGEAVSSAELVRRMARALGRPARLLPVPPAALRLAGRLTGRGAAVERLLGSLEIDDEPTRLTLGWTPPYTMAEGLAEAAAWYRSTGGEE